MILEVLLSFFFTFNSATSSLEIISVGNSFWVLGYELKFCSLDVMISIMCRRMYKQLFMFLLWLGLILFLYFIYYFSTNLKDIIDEVHKE